jgi:hypothetical protein
MDVKNQIVQHAPDVSAVVDLGLRYVENLFFPLLE